MTALVHTRIIGNVICDHEAALSSHDLRWLIEYWQSKRRSRPMPSRNDIDVLELRRLLGNLFLIDVVSRPYGFRFRLVGTEITNKIGRELTGRSAAELFTGDDRREVFAVYATVVARKHPVSLQATLIWRARPYARCEAILLPLAGDGARVNMIFGGFAWT